MMSLWTIIDIPVPSFLLPHFLGIKVYLLRPWHHLRTIPKQSKTIVWLFTWTTQNLNFCPSLTTVCVQNGCVGSFNGLKPYHRDKTNHYVTIRGAIMMQILSWLPCLLDLQLKMTLSKFTRLEWQVWKLISILSLKWQSNKFTQS